LYQIYNDILLIEDSQKEKERQELKINELLEERSYLQETTEIMETSFKELRLKFEEFKTQNEIFSKVINKTKI